MTVRIEPRFLQGENQNPGMRLLARLDWGLVLAVVVLTCVGCFFIFSATLHNGRASFLLTRQISAACVGSVALVFLTLLPYQGFQTYHRLVYGFCLFLLVVTLVFGVSLRGSRSWIDLGPIYFQPIEVVRLGLATVLASLACRRDVRFWWEAVFLVVVAVVPFGLVLCQPDLSSALAILPMLFSVLYVAGAPTGFLVALGVCGALSLGIPLADTFFSTTADRWVSAPALMRWVARSFQETKVLLSFWGGVLLFLALGWWFLRRWRIYLSVFSLVVALSSVAVGVAGSFAVDRALKTYQRKRLIAFVDPGVDPLGAGYNILQSQIAIGSGRLVGKGYLSGSQAQLGFLPEKHTDFIFSLIGEETGFLGAFLVLGLYAWVVWRAFDIAAKARDHFGRYLAVTLGTFFAFSGVVNMGMAMGLMPITGIPLPFLSYGGSGLVGSYMAIGLLMSIHWRRYGV